MRPFSVRATSRRALRPTIAAFVLGLAGAASADEGKEPSDRPVVGEPVELTVVGSKQPESFASTKGITTVKAKEIRAIAPGSLADALRSQSGVSVQQTTPGQGTIYVRGLAGRELVFLIDGVRLNTAVFRSPNNAPLGLIDPLSVFWLEAIRGSSSVLHGSDALGGVINVSTTLPAYSDDPTSIVKAYTSASTNPRGLLSRVSVSHQRETWSAHVGVSWASFGDVTPGGGLLSPVPRAYAYAERAPDGVYVPTALSRAQIGTGWTRMAADGVLRWQLAETTEAIVRAQWSERPELVRYDEITPRFDLDGRPARASAFIGPMFRSMTSLTLSHRPQGSILDTALLTLAWQRMGDTLHRRDMDEACVTGGEVADCTSRLRLVPAAKAKNEVTRSDALSARGELRFLSDDKTRAAVFGVEAIRDTIASRAWSLKDGVLSDASSRYPDGSKMTQGGAFAQLESQLLPGLRGHVGLRHAMFSLDIPARGDAEPIRRTLMDWAASAGLRFSPAPGLAWVVNAGRGVRSPNVEDYAGAGTRAGGRFQVPNPSLAPEHTQSADVGVKVHHGLVRAETFVFLMRFEDAVGVTSTTVNGASTAPDGSRYVTSANVARLDLYGIESDVRVGHEKRGGAYGRFLLVGYDEAKTPGVSASERVATPPSLVLGSWIHPVPKLRLEVFAHARGAMHRKARLDDDRIPAGGTDAFVTVHARAAYAVSPDVTARVGVDNATNVRALEYGSGFHLPGLSVMAGLEARLAL